VNTAFGLRTEVARARVTIIAVVGVIDAPFFDWVAVMEAADRREAEVVTEHWLIEAITDGCVAGAWITLASFCTFLCVGARTILWVT